MVKSLTKVISYEGEWVSGKTEYDEKIRGFIEAVNHSNHTFKIRVTQSDNEMTVGRLVETPIHFVDVLQVESFNQEGQILNLIDFALLIKDKSWFMELTSQLNEIQQKKIKL